MPAADFTTVQRLDALLPPNVTATDSFFEFLFRRAPEPYDVLKRKAAAQEALPSFRLDGVKITFNVDADYQVAIDKANHSAPDVIVPGGAPGVASAIAWTLSSIAAAPGQSPLAAKATPRA